MIFFFNDTATTEIYTLSLHDALPISENLVESDRRARYGPRRTIADARDTRSPPRRTSRGPSRPGRHPQRRLRSEEHTSELQSRQYLVCRLLLEKKNSHVPFFSLSLLR